MWSGHIERMNGEFVKKVYVSEIKGPSTRGRTFRRWKDLVREHMSNRVVTRGGGLEQARRECLDGEGWRLIYSEHLP